MKLSSGVEWAAHACTLLATLPERGVLNAEAIAEYHGVPPAYMAKQIQALSKAGLVKSAKGAKGGYCLAKPPVEISLMDITAAIEGGGPIFRCTEIRQNGPCGSNLASCKIPCSIAARFHEAEIAYSEVLSNVTVLDLVISVAQNTDKHQLKKYGNWLQEKL